jgi:hypothetical protein
VIIQIPKTQESVEEHCEVVAHKSGQLKIGVSSWHVCLGGAGPAVCISRSYLSFKVSLSAAMRVTMTPSMWVSTI